VHASSEEATPASPTAQYAWDKLITDKSLRKRLKQKLAGKLINELKPRTPTVSSPHGLAHFKFGTAAKVVTWIAKAKHTMKQRKLLEVRERLMQAISEENNYDNPEDRPVVSTLKEGEHVSITKQVNVDFYNEDAIFERENLSMDGEINFNLLQWWRGMKKNANGKIEKDTYIKMCCIISSLLVPDGTEDERRQIAEEDWIYDAEGNDEMDQDQFTRSLFILTDHWCLTLKREEYIGFVRAVHAGTSQKAIKNGLDIMEEYKQHAFDYQDYSKQLKSEYELKEKRRGQRKAQRNKETDANSVKAGEGEIARLTTNTRNLQHDIKKDNTQESLSARQRREEQERQDIFEIAKREEEHIMESAEELKFVETPATEDSEQHDDAHSPNMHDGYESSSISSPQHKSNITKRVKPVQKEDQKLVHDSHGIEDELEENIVPNKRYHHDIDDDSEHFDFLERIRLENEEIERLRAWRMEKEKSIQRLLEEERRRLQVLQENESMNPNDDPELERIQRLLHHSRMEMDDNLKKEKRIREKIGTMEELCGSGQRQKSKSGKKHILRLVSQDSKGDHQMQQLTGINKAAVSTTSANRNMRKNGSASPKRAEKVDFSDKRKSDQDIRLPQSKNSRAPKVRAGVSSTVTILKVAKNRIAATEEKKVFKDIEVNTSQRRLSVNSGAGDEDIEEMIVDSQRGRTLSLNNRTNMHEERSGGLTLLTSINAHEAPAVEQGLEPLTAGTASLGIPISRSFEAFPYRAPLGRKRMFRTRHKSFDGSFIQDTLKKRNAGLIVSKRSNGAPTHSGVVRSNPLVAHHDASPQQKSHKDTMYSMPQSSWKNPGGQAAERRRRSLSPQKNFSRKVAANIPGMVSSMGDSLTNMSNNNAVSTASRLSDAESTSSAVEWNYTLRVRGKRY